jgi:hypothetical protein
VGDVRPAERGASEPFLPVLLIAAGLGVVGLVIVLAILELVVTPVDIPAPFGTENQDAETAIFAISIFGILPGSLVAAGWIDRVIRAGPNAAALRAVSRLAIAVPACGLLLVKAWPGGHGVREALAVFAVVGAGMVVGLAAAAREPFVGRVLGGQRAGDATGIVAGGLVLGALLPFVALGSISVVGLLVGGAAMVLVVAAHRRGLGPPRLGPRGGLAVDAVVVLAVLVAVPQLDVFGNPGITLFHQDLWLGPADRLLHGHTMLVDTASQYGIGSIYFLAGWFKLAPIGYGTLSFLDGLLFAGLFATGYGVLRLAGISRLLAGTATALAVVVLTYNLIYPVGTIPQHGPIRFGLPLALIAAAVWEARAPERRRVAWGLQLAALAISSVWMFETFGYTAATFAGLLAMRSWGPEKLGSRWALRGVLAALAAIVAAQLVLVVATLIASGHLPDYGLYYTFLHAFLTGPLSNFTFDFSSFSPGLPVGFAYGLNLMAVLLLAARRPEVAGERPAAFTALAGLAVFGLVLFSYFVDRSQDLVLPYVSLPLILSGAIWLDLILRSGLEASGRARGAALSIACALAVLVTSVAWSSISPRFSSSLAGHVVPGGESLHAAFHSLWNPPALDDRSEHGVRLLDRYAPGQSVTPMLVSSTPGVEIALRSGRANALPFSDPLEDGFANLPTRGWIRASVAGIRPGERLLTQGVALRVLAAIRRDPHRDLRTDPVDLGGALTAQQEGALQDVANRFRLRVLHRDGGSEGLVVLGLGARR